jgi:MFS family permease
MDDHAGSIRSSLPRKIYIGCLAGWTLDALDFQLFFLALPDVSRTLSLSSEQAALVSSAALFASAIGGWIAGVTADRIGRVSVLQIAVILYSLASVLSAFAADANQLLVARVVLGLGFGAEWTTGAVLLSEWAKDDRRGRVVGSMLSGWGIGWALAAVTYYLCTRFFPFEQCWRVAFALGGLPALLVVYIRRSMIDAPVFLNSAKLRPSHSRPFSLARVVLLAVTISTSVQGAYYALHVWLPTFYRVELGISIERTTAFVLIAALGSIGGSAIGAVLSDRIGRRRLLWLSSAILWVVVLLLVYWTPSTGISITLNFVAGLVPSLMFSALTPLLAELFPTHIRATFQGLTYNLGRAIGAGFPMLVGMLQSHIGLSSAIAAFVGAAIAILSFATYALAETKGKSLAFT